MNTKVSVIIVTYNSGDFIIETLESVFNLLWKEIELIITDDCSTDNTVELCETWLKDHQERFLSTQLITTEINTGVSANGNRGLEKATGEWVKFLGGDDAFAPAFLTNSMEHVAANPEIRVLFSQLNVYRETFEQKNFVYTTPEEIGPYSIFWPERDAESQHRILLNSDRIHFTPTAFMHRETLLSLGGFDERFRDFEDYTLWLNLTRKGYKLHFMHKVTVNYRRHSSAQNNTGNPQVVNPNYFKEEDMRKIYTYPYMPPLKKMDARFKWHASQLFRIKWLNKDTKLNVLLWQLFTFYLNPFSYVIAVKKRVDPKVKGNELYL